MWGRESLLRLFAPGLEQNVSAMVERADKTRVIVLGCPVIIFSLSLKSWPNYDVVCP